MSPEAVTASAPGGPACDPTRHLFVRCARSLALSLAVALAVSLALLLGSPAGHAQSELRWVPGDTDLDQQLAVYLTESQVVTDLVMLIDENFELDTPLGITVGSGSDANGVPSYSSEDRQIRLPYAYLAQAVRAQSMLLEGAYPDDDAQAAAARAVGRAMDTVEYTLYHLLGHALLDDDKVEVDDRVEAISSWLMISAWHNGAEQWVADVQAFSEASRRLEGSQEEYWHAHGLYRIREETLTCWALGAEPDAVEPLLPMVADSFERRARCTRSWARLDEQMLTLLDGMLKPDAPLRADVE